MRGKLHYAVSLLLSIFLAGTACLGCGAGSTASGDGEKRYGMEKRYEAEEAGADAGQGKAEVPVKARTYRNVAYYTSWSAYARNVMVADIDASLLTHINFAFANLNADGEIAVGDSWVDTDKPMGKDTWETTGVKGHFGQLKNLKKKYPRLKTLISVGGWTWSGNFSQVAASDAKRKKFAGSAAAFLQKYGFDGLDIDWEFPVEGGNGIPHRPEDKQNYTKLLKEIRTALDEQGKKDKKTYLLTIAGGPNTSFTRNVEMKKIMEYVDFINIMTYDYHGGWEGVTNHNAPLYAGRGETSQGNALCVSATVDAYINAGAAPGALNLGLPFYGRGWTQVAGGGNNGLHQNGTVPAGTGYGLGTWEGGVFDYSDLEKNYLGKKGYRRYYDKEAQVPYLFNGSTFISYDDKESVLAKLKFAKEKGLGGAMFWELAGDKDKTLQKAAADCLNILPAASGTGPAKKPAEAKKPVESKDATKAWDKSAVYTAGDRVTYKSKKYKAKWWTQGEKPDSGGEWGPWEKL